jgi:hypothetical protein
MKKALLIMAVIACIALNISVILKNVSTSHLNSKPLKKQPKDSLQHSTKHLKTKSCALLG